MEKGLSIQSVRLMVVWLSCLRERGYWSVSPHSPQLYFSKQFTKLTLWLLAITFFELGSCQFTPRRDGAISQCPQNHVWCRASSINITRRNGN